MRVEFANQPASLRSMPTKRWWAFCKITGAWLANVSNHPRIYYGV